METRLRFGILPQPDETTCGPTCLHAVYNYYHDAVDLETVIDQVPQFDEGGGTLAVLLGCDALRRGYRAAIYTYNLQVFDPTWFEPGVDDLRERLRAQAAFKQAPKLRRASEAYVEFIANGGEIRFRDLTPGLIRRYLKQGKPILTGLSATYLYRWAREYGPRADHDDIRGEPSGHFVVLCGYDTEARTVLVADPYLPNPLGERNHYEISIDRVICAILLGILTYDANLLVIEPSSHEK